MRTLGISAAANKRAQLNDRPIKWHIILVQSDEEKKKKKKQCKNLSEHGLASSWKAYPVLVRRLIYWKFNGEKSKRTVSKNINLTVNLLALENKVETWKWATRARLLANCTASFSSAVNHHHSNGAHFPLSDRWFASFGKEMRKLVIEIKRKIIFRYFDFIDLYLQIVCQLH